ncbi:MAG: hypothetical protein KDJ31_11755 [Candidatus Competibacteraceae bacterium]|nr:hypothetical protein [Candidatus Competibacteraceae bacterium]
MTQLAPHEWASCVIQPRLRAAYRMAAKYEIFENPISLTPTEFLWTVQGRNRRYSLWALKLLFQHGSGKDTWRAIRDPS